MVEEKNKREIPRFLVLVEHTDVFYGTWGCILRDTESCNWPQSCNLPRWFGNFRISCCCNRCRYPWQLSLILTDDISLFDGYFSHLDCSPCCAVIYRLHLTLLNRSSPADVAETRCMQFQLLFVVEDRVNGRNLLDLHLPP